VHTCHLSYAAGISRRIADRATTQDYLKNNLKQKELEVWLKW
jgi:hypothetical protein